MFFHQSVAKARKKRELRVQEQLKVTSALAVTSEEGLVAKQTQLRQAYVASRIRALTQRRPLMLWELLLDPTSFVRSVENFFDFAFAVRDGVVRLTFEEWDAEMAFPLVSWRVSEREAQRQRKKMQHALQRLNDKLEHNSQALEDEPGDGEQGSGALNAQDRAALRAARREKRVRRVYALVRRMRALDAAELAERQAQARASIARQKAEAQQDRDPHNHTHFTPTLDYHTWSGMVIKLGLREPLIPAMTEEDEREWAVRWLSKHGGATEDDEIDTAKRKQRAINVDEDGDEGDRRAEDEAGGAADDAIEFIDE